MLSVYLAGKEILRNKFRFFMVIMIVALITIMVLFLAAMGDGLAQGAKQYIEQIDAQLIALQADADLSIPASRLDRGILRQISRVDGVDAVGPIGFSVVALMLNGQTGIEKLNVTLIGVEPGLPGAPAVSAGSALTDRHSKQVLLDQNVLDRVAIPLGSTITIRVVQGTDEEFYDLTVVGYTTGQKYNFIPSIFVPLPVWDRIRPQEHPGSSREIIFNVAAVRLKDSANAATLADAIEQRVTKVEVADPETTYKATQGFKEMQSTTVAQQNVMQFIVLLIVGGFFQIQTLQKVPQIGMLRAIGAANGLVVATLLAQVLLTTVVGLTIGGIIVWGLVPLMPPGIPMVFEARKVVTVLVTLLAIGPLAGLVAIRTLLKIEPLTALGLG